MIISNKNKRSVGRPSLRCISVRRAPHHHALNFSRKSATEFNLQEGNKISLQLINGKHYLCVNAESGYNLKVKKNGGQHKKYNYDTFTCSTVEIVDTLLSLAKAEKVAKFILSTNATTMDGQKYYLIIPKPLQAD